MNLDIIGNAAVGGSDPNNSKSVPLAGNVKFKIGDISIENGLMAVGAAGETIDGVDGIIGKYLFDDAVVTINWKDSKLILTKPGNFVYHGNGETIPIHILPSGHIYTEINVEKNGKKVIAKSDIDLGNRSNFYIDKETAAPIMENGDKISNIIVSWGANGPTYGDITRTTVGIGSIHLNEVITAVSPSNKLLKKDGLLANIGLSILERFTLIFDYQNSRLILEKIDNEDKEFNFSQSGIILNPKKDGENVLIADIVPKSAAQDNGLLKDDRITTINGKKVKDLPVDLIDELLKGETVTTLELVILRNGNEFKSVLKMRKMI